MRQKIKLLIEKIFQPLAKKLGYTKVTQQGQEIINKNNLLDNFFGVLRSINFIPQNIVDVGANRGGWTRETLRYFPKAYYTLFEPQSQLKQYINDVLVKNPKVTLHAVGVGSKSGVFKFTIVDRDDSCSFSYSEDEAKNAGFTQIDIPVVTLNDF